MGIFRFSRPRLQAARYRPGGRAHVIETQARQRGLRPLEGCKRAVSVLRPGRLIDVLRTVVVVEDLFAVREGGTVLRA